MLGAKRRPPFRLAEGDDAATSAVSGTEGDDVQLKGRPARMVMDRAVPDIAEQIDAERRRGGEVSHPRTAHLLEMRAQNLRGEHRAQRRPYPRRPAPPFELREDRTHQGVVEGDQRFGHPPHGAPVTQNIVRAQEKTGIGENGERMREVGAGPTDI